MTMTDNEIIKALECHMTNSLDNCEKCPLFAQKNVFYNCRRYLCESSLALINRQKAEIEKLKENQDTLTATLARSLAVKMSGGDPIAETKAETIKEFVKKLKDYYNNHIAYGKPTAYTDVGHIFLVLDDLLEEMVGADNANG